MSVGLDLRPLIHYSRTASLFFDWAPVYRSCSTSFLSVSPYRSTFSSIYLSYSFLSLFAICCHICIPMWSYHLSCFSCINFSTYARITTYVVFPTLSVLVFSSVLRNPILALFNLLLPFFVAFQKFFVAILHFFVASSYNTIRST